MVAEVEEAVAEAVAVDEEVVVVADVVADEVSVDVGVEEEDSLLVDEVEDVAEAVEEASVAEAGVGDGNRSIRIILLFLRFTNQNDRVFLFISFHPCINTNNSNLYSICHSRITSCKDTKTLDIEINDQYMSNGFPPCCCWFPIPAPLFCWKVAAI